MADGKMSLVDFLTDLRADLLSAREQAVSDAVKDLGKHQSALWFDVDEISVTLEVEHSDKVGGKATAEVGGAFWVFVSAKAGAEVSGETSGSNTQTLTLTLKPRLQTKRTNSDTGKTELISTQLAITGAVVEGES